MKKNISNLIFGLICLGWVSLYCSSVQAWSQAIHNTASGPEPGSNQMALITYDCFYDGVMLHAGDKDCNATKTYDTKANHTVKLEIRCAYSNTAQKDVYYEWGVRGRYEDELKDVVLNSQRDSYGASSVNFRIPGDFTTEGDLAAVVWVVCYYGDKDEPGYDFANKTLSKTFNFNVESAKVEVELSSNKSEIVINDTAELTAKIMGDYKTCTDAYCTGILKKWINDVMNAADDSGLDITLDSVRSQYVSGNITYPEDGGLGVITLIPAYVAKFTVTARELGDQSVVVRFDGNESGQFGIDDYTWDVVEQPTDADGDGYDTTSDCDDTRTDVYPGAPEVCDGADNDCDGSIDEGVTTTFYQDADSDGYGNPASSLEGCLEPIGYVVDNTDCDDSLDSVNPGADEVCLNSRDDDCDGSVDEVECITGIDADGDGVDSSSDCDDADDTVGAPTTYYEDADGDGYGDPTSSIESCSEPTGYVEDNTDCNDDEFSAFPTNTEACGDSVDNDCDGVVDEADCSELIVDHDGDGFLNDTDCDDNNKDVYPGATEVCGDSLDNNCDGTVDETTVCPESKSTPPESAPTSQGQVSGGALSFGGCSLRI